MKIHRHLVDEIVKTLQEIFAGRVYADKAIERVLKFQRRWGSRDRKFFAESIYDCVRWQRRLAALIEPADEGSELYCLRLWATLAFEQGWLEDQDPAEWGIDPQAYERRLKDLEQKGSRAVRESIPDWLDERGQLELGDRWPAILHSLNEKSTVDLRVNTLKTSREKAQQALQAEQIEAVVVANVPTALTLKERRNVFITQAFQQGFFEVQDRASQLVAPILDPQPGERIADACAGAGGKTLHIAALMKNKGRILSLDIHEWKLNELRQRTRRAGVDIVETRVIESTKVIKRLADGFDRVLLDVPCSGLGVLRRNPDTKWKLSEEEIARLQNLQMEILTSYSRMVKPGGVLVYATCSFLPSENNQQIEKFLGSHPAWSLVEETKIFPDQGRGDGFYAAKLRKTSG